MAAPRLINNRALALAAIAAVVALALLPSPAAAKLVYKSDKLSAKNQDVAGTPVASDITATGSFRLVFPTETTYEWTLSLKQFVTGKQCVCFFGGGEGQVGAFQGSWAKRDTIYPTALTPTLKPNATRLCHKTQIPQGAPHPDHGPHPPRERHDARRPNRRLVRGAANGFNARSDHAAAGS
jgi:hypothetical protein